MRITESQLRKIIRRTLLSEQVFGAQAFVYHGSNSPPDEFLPFILENKFIPGKGAGAMYGKGLYTVYNLRGTNTSSGDYGRYVYKLKVNLHGFICFDSTVAEKVYKKKLSPADQARLLGRPTLVKKLESVVDDDDPYTSGEAHRASKFLSGHVKGIVFTGRNDGQVVVIYDASVVTPVSWSVAPILSNEQDWQRVDPGLVRKQIKKNLEQSWQEEKYEITKKIKPGSIIEGDHEFENAVFLSPDVRFNGNLTIEGVDDVPIPEGIAVAGNLKIWSYNPAVLPKISVGGDLIIKTASNLSKLPDGLTIGGNLKFGNCPSLTDLPGGMSVGGAMDLDGTAVKELPQDLYVGGKGAIENYDVAILPLPLWQQYVNGLKERDPTEYQRISSEFKKAYAQYMARLHAQY